MSDDSIPRETPTPTEAISPAKVRVATVWLDGCSGCHMSLLDMDERIIELAQQIEVVCSPYVDLKEFPDEIDLALVEGAVSSVEDLHKVKELRSRAKLLVALGDCAVTGNVPAMRNWFPIEELMERAYIDTATEPLPRQVASEASGEAAPVASATNGGAKNGGATSGGEAPVEPWYPSRYVPALRTRSSPVHEVVNVDLFVPGCPPPADAIHFVLSELLAGRRPDVSRLTRFGR